ncbi:MAG: GNAT family N-acetyltransferase [Bacteroidetes bacterium]|nr:GNAT family N-acetyltransferase [Bacteroidota bacterium]
MQAHAFFDSDVEHIRELQPDGWGDISSPFDFYTKSSFCFPIKILSEDKTVGIGSTIVHYDVAWLGHIIVHPEYRNKGIGRLITETLINIAKEKNCKTVYLIATDLGAPVYEKVGFVTESEYLFFTNVKMETTASISENIILYEERFKEQVSLLDEITSGEDRMMHVEGFLESGFVYNNNATIEGFYLPTFGNGLIIASSTNAGIELLKFHLRSSENVILPKENVTAIDFLYKNGFKEMRIAKRMRLGKERTHKLENIYNRIAGNVG